MAVAKYRDPGTGNWVTVPGLAGVKGPPGAPGPAGGPGADGSGMPMTDAYLRYVDIAGDTLQGDVALAGNPIVGVGADTAADSVATVGQIDALRNPVLAAVSDEWVPVYETNPMWVDPSDPPLEWDTDWVPLLPVNGWYYTTHASLPGPGCRLLPDGRVLFRGLVQHEGAPTASEAIVVPPAGYRHNTALLFNLYLNANAVILRARIGVRDGEIRWNEGVGVSTGTNSITLDGIQYTPEA